MPSWRTLINCCLSAAASYGALRWGNLLSAATALPATVFLLIPGPVFYLALQRSIGRRAPVWWRIAMAVVVSAGWYFAYQSAAAIETPLYVPGGVAGAIGGAAVAVVLLPHRPRRLWFCAALLVLAGAALGAIGLPAGFINDNADYILLTFLIWQIGMGLIVTGLTTRFANGLPLRQ